MAESRFAHAGTTGLTLEALAVGVELRSKSISDRAEYQFCGVALEIIEGSRFFDADGELHEIPLTVVVFDPAAPPGREWHRLTEQDINLASVKPYPKLGKLARRLAYDFSRPKGKTRTWSNLLSGHDLDTLRYLGALGRVIGGGT